MLINLTFVYFKLSSSSKHQSSGPIIHPVRRMPTLTIRAAEQRLHDRTEVWILPDSHRTNNMNKIQHG
ncbi:hypothetical protein AMECASPLE_033101 [Ameca splendens]|uniref:Uncharacterized protein n=1 Tax=Ameca splendens TaxID=208324 RepID=A0ABV0ZRM5_9TELE